MRSALDRLFPETRSVLLDGAMGTSLHRLGWPRQMATVMANLEAPQWVAQVHAEHRAAGARVLQTNTFGVLLGADEQRLEVTRAAVKLALEAATGGAMVAGALAGYDLSFHGPVMDDVVRVMVDEGVDLLVFETCNTRQDARAALDAAARLAPRLPVVVCASTTDGSREDRKRLDEIVGVLAARGSDHAELGLNCCRGPSEALRVALSLETMPRWIKPSVGPPDDPANDHVMAAFARAARIHGARFVGGCCGTEAAALSAMSGALGCLDR